MDFSKFDARSAASKPFDLHLRHPATNTLLYNDAEQKEPCIVMVYGIESPQIQKQLAALQRAAMTAGDGVRQSNEELHDAAVQMAKVFIAGFKNMYRTVDGEERPMNVSDAEWFLNLQMLNGNRNERSFVEQVTNCANKRANYLGKS